MTSLNVTMAARQAVREQAMPSKVSLDVPNAETIRAMEDTKKGVDLSRSFSSGGQFDMHLLEQVQEELVYDLLNIIH